MIKKGTKVRILKNKIHGIDYLKRLGVWRENEEIYGITRNDYIPRDDHSCDIIFENGKSANYYHYKFEVVDELSQIKPRGHKLTTMFQFENSKK